MIIIATKSDDSSNNFIGNLMLSRLPVLKVNNTSLIAIGTERLLLST
jgi:hypothetical protein